MPRQRSSMGGGGSRRPTASPAKAPTPQQARPASTAAYTPARTPMSGPPAPHATAPQSGGGSMLGNIASTAAGVAIGSSVGHAITGFFGGGSSVQEPQESALAAQGQHQNAQNQWGARNCDVDAKQFTKCLDENRGDMQICGWYLEQLKACQSAAAQY